VTFEANLQKTGSFWVSCFLVFRLKYYSIRAWRWGLCRKLLFAV